MVPQSFSHIKWKVAKSSQSLKGGCEKVLPCLEEKGGGGVREVSDPH